VKCSWMKFSEVLSNRVSNIIRRYTDHGKFAAYIAFSYITVFHIVSVPFLSLYVLNASASFCKLCISIVTFMYSYFYVRSVLCIVSLSCSVHCLCVNVYCTTATGCQHNCSLQIYQYPQNRTFESVRESTSIIFGERINRFLMIQY
jgi:hypothetical protein